MKGVQTHLQLTAGIHLLSSIAWTEEEADLVIFMDTSLTGFGMWLPALHVAYYRRIPPSSVRFKIFYYEALAVVCAIHWAAQRTPLPRQVAIHTDNMNTVDMFSSMKPRVSFVEMMKFAVDVLLASNMDLRVFHISGNLNDVADKLSRNQLSAVHDSHPDLQILHYEPPSQLLGALAP